MIEDYMNLAIQQAKLGGVATYRNPQVGAVLVKDGKVLAQGYHHCFGKDHAEVDVLRQVGQKETNGSTLFVTLEPCSHFGKTPPCSHRIVQAGIKKIFIGQLDPHPIVAGKGKQYLIDHGVEVIDGILTKEVMKLNPHYNLYYQKSRPWITMKMAMTLDGKINQNSKERSMISNHESYIDSQVLRSKYQAILVGENTLKIDNPRLTVRIFKMENQPVRLFLVKNSDQIIGKKLLEDTSVETWILTKETSVGDDVVSNYKNIRIKNGNWTPQAISKFCFENGWQSLLVEGGSKIQAEFINSNLVDEWIEYLSPMVFGGNALPVAFNINISSRKLDFKLEQVNKLGTDFKIKALRKEEK